MVKILVPMTIPSCDIAKTWSYEQKFPLKLTDNLFELLATNNPIITSKKQPIFKPRIQSDDNAERFFFF